MTNKEEAEKLGEQIKEAVRILQGNWMGYLAIKNARLEAAIDSLVALASQEREFERGYLAGRKDAHELHEIGLLAAAAGQARPPPLACPFCKHVGLDFAEGSTFRWLTYSCGGCGISNEVRVKTAGTGTPEEWRAQAEANAIEVWNARAALSTDAASTAGEAAGSPTTGVDEDGHAVLEWRGGTRKLTLYTVAPRHEALLKSWGANMETEMEFVDIEDGQAVKAAFAWLARAEPAGAQAGGASVRAIIESLVACHEEPSCPAVALAREWLANAPVRDQITAKSQVGGSAEEVWRARLWELIDAYRNGHDWPLSCRERLKRHIASLPAAEAAGARA